jgi:hypothetical protein
VRFYLGTHKPAWLAQLAIPLFVSHRTLRRVRQLPRARAPWALDSGGFSELKAGGWRTTALDYIAAVRRYRDEIGLLEWAAPMDWMCEAEQLAATGLSVRKHQVLTVQNFLELRIRAPELPWIPVLQGWTLGQYIDCAELYEQMGVSLRREPLVGVGSVCRRQSRLFPGALFCWLAQDGLRLHGFGVKTDGLLLSQQYLASADSLAWSFQATKRPPLPGHHLPGPGRRTGHKNCANCQEYALLWRERLFNQIGHDHDRHRPASSLPHQQHVA